MVYGVIAVSLVLLVIAMIVVFDGTDNYDDDF